MRRLLSAATVLICLASASAASAAPRSFYGVISANDPSAAEFTRLGTARVGTFRLNFNWQSIQPAGPGTFDWSRYDYLIGQAAQQGIRVLPTIYGSPGWAADKPNHPPSSGSYDEFEAFCREAAARYGANGTFWALNPLVPKIPITDWQLWNEVNSPSFWLPKPNPKLYKALLAVTDRGIGSGDPKARIMLAGLFRTPRVKNGVFMDKYLTALYKSKAKPLFDAVAVHPYATNPRRALKAVREARAIMDRFKDRRKPIWLTEVGWATGGTKTPLTVSPKRQAGYLTEIYRTTGSKRTRKRFKIGGVIWYSLRDIPGAIWFNNTGLFTQSGAAKPSWKAFARVAGGKP